MSARSIADGKKVMADMASISARMAEVVAQKAQLTERRVELEEQERQLWAEWTRLLAAEAGSENPVDLRTRTRRRREVVPRKTGPVSEESLARVAQELAEKDWNRRSG